MRFWASSLTATWLGRLSYSIKSPLERQREIFAKRLARSSSRGSPLTSNDNIQRQVMPSRDLEAKPVIDTSSLSCEQALESILGQDCLLIQRQYEMMNIFFGYEQYNRYAIMAPHLATQPMQSGPLTTGTTSSMGHTAQSFGSNGALASIGSQDSLRTAASIEQQPSVPIVGYLVEETGLLKSMTRQVLGTHRPMKALLMDVQGRPLLHFSRPWTLINSRLRVHALHPNPSKNEPSQGRLLGEVHQIWHLWRRQYELFSAENANPNPAMRQPNLIPEEDDDEIQRQFGRIDGGFLSWDFHVYDDQQRCTALVTRNFTHLIREMFTDSGQYLVNFVPNPRTAVVSSGGDLRRTDTAHLASHDLMEQSHANRSASKAKPLSLEQRATILGAAVSVDFDYFSRHSDGLGFGGGFGFPFIFPGFGGDTNDDGKADPMTSSSTSSSTALSSEDKPLATAEDDEESRWAKFFGASEDDSFEQEEDVSDEDGW